MKVFRGKRVLLGVTGSIAAFKAADLASKLAQSEAEVDTVLTDAAQKFIAPLTFQSVTGRRAYTESDLWGHEAHTLHVGLGHHADVIVIAPCSANTIAKIANGMADNLLTLTVLASHCPILLAPAMDGGMYENRATQENLEKLKTRGVEIVGPAQGHLASGLTGMGRMVEPAEILGRVRIALGKNGKLAGKKVVVTAGGTQEAIDPVRVVTNRSSGKQGYALAQAALDSGADVRLIAVPSALTSPIGARLIHAENARQMLDAVLKECDDADVLVMAAAVADFRPKNAADDKMKKRDGIPQIELEATEDILKAAAAARSGRKRPRVIVGFAAESRDLIENAREKLTSKKVDMIVANDISARDAGFGVETNRVTILYVNGNTESLPLMSKMDVAENVMEKISVLLEQ